MGRPRILDMREVFNGIQFKEFKIYVSQPNRRGSYFEMRVWAFWVFADENHDGGGGEFGAGSVIDYEVSLITVGG